MKNIITLLSASLILMFSSCGSEETKTPKKEKTPIIVHMNSNSINTNSSYLSTSGKIEALKSATISTRMMGSVSTIHVSVGQQVKKGQLILSIENSDILAKKAQIKSGIIQATASLKNAEKDYKRYEKLIASESTSQKEMDDMTTRYDMAKAQLNSALAQQKEINAQLEYSMLKAPFDGIITNKYIEEGNMANPGMPLLEIENTVQFKILTSIPESQIGTISLDTKVRVLVKSLNTEYEGVITEIGSSSKNSGGQYLVKIMLEKQPKLLSGMYTTIHFFNDEITKNKNVFVPNSALVTRGQLTGIYTVSESNTAILRWVRLGVKKENSVEILSGLNASEKYIVSAEEKLYNGAAITVQ